MNGILSRAINKSFRVFDRISGILDNRSIEALMQEELEGRLSQNRKTVLYVGLRYDYGNRNWGLSYEFFNFYNTLANMNCSVIFFDYDRLRQKYGQEKMSQILRETAYYYDPDFVLYFHFHDWIDHRVWKEISEFSKSIIWLADDQWRYEETRQVWKLFNLVVTTDRKGFERRKHEGFDNVFLSQWGCNHFLYRDMKMQRIHDVTFVGRAYGRRMDFVRVLRNKGVNIRTFGQGWNKSPRIHQSDLLKIYNQSKISLNISFSSTEKGELQIKGRDFEAPSCGSLLLTQEQESLSQYFTPNKEIVTYKDAYDAADKIKYLLKNQDILNRIAENGKRRVIREHTFEKRFTDIFDHAIALRTKGTSCEDKI